MPVELPIAEEGSSRTKRIVTEPSFELPSTQTQSGATFHKRKGKEKGDAVEETIERPQEV